MAAALIPDIAYPGSFQEGNLFRSGDPLRGVWRHIERVGTLENLTRIATSKGHDASKANLAALRVRQAVEFRSAASNSSSVTRPVLLYYSALNLVRALLLIGDGQFGGPSHGLRYIPAGDLASCSARVTRTGTFSRFAAILGLDAVSLQDRVFTFGQLAHSIPELHNDAELLHAGASLTAVVFVRAMMGGSIFLEYSMSLCEAEHFEQRWPSLLPWFAEICEYAGKPFTLRAKERTGSRQDVVAFCRKHLLHDVEFRDNPIWFDHVVREDVTPIPILASYLGALHIVSNICRYEPELLHIQAAESTDRGFFLRSFLDASERYFPQRVLEIFWGRDVYFS